MQCKASVNFYAHNRLHARWIACLIDDFYKLHLILIFVLLTILYFCFGGYFCFGEKKALWGKRKTVALP